jgi:hypothetical protein
MGVETTNPKYDKLAPKWQRCRDAAEGQDAVHEAGELYLPKLKDQEWDDYCAYKTRAGFFNATWRTIAGLQGMLFRKPPVVTVPASVTPLLDSITESAQPLQIFALEVVEECLTVGRAGILVDYPVVAEEGVTQADAILRNLRPTMSLYETETIVNWKEETLTSQKVLTRVILKEDRDAPDPDDEFVEKCETIYRVLDLFEGKYRTRLFVKVESSADSEQFAQEGEDLFPKMNNQPLGFIPFYFLGVDDAEPCPDDPPLIDLVDVNLSHYRTNADYEHGCHFTGLPTGWISGHTLEQGDKIYLGSQNMLVFPNPETKVGFLEFSGAGLKCLSENLERKERQMAVLGARMLETQKKATEATDTAKIHRAGEASMLASMAQSISISMQKALQVFSDWAGGSGDVIFELNRDFFPANLDSSQLTALVASWQYGAISKETLFENLKQAEIVSDTKTFEEQETEIANAAPTLTAPPQDPNQQGV